jgi:hypothetical protein
MCTAVVALQPGTLVTQELSWCAVGPESSTNSHATGATMSGLLAGSTWGAQNAYTGCHTWCLPPYHQPFPLAPTMHPRCDFVHCVGIKALLPCAPHHTLGILGGTTWAECALACVWWVRYRHVTRGSEEVLRCVPLAGGCDQLTCGGTWRSPSPCCSCCFHWSRSSRPRRLPSCPPLRCVSASLLAFALWSGVWCPSQCLCDRLHSVL